MASRKPYIAEYHTQDKLRTRSKGTLILGVRNDIAVDVSNADGNLAPLQFDSRGRLFTSIDTADGEAVDAFGRFRTSHPFTVFNSKQLYDKLLWTESLESGAGITSSFSSDTASTTITSTLNTAGKFTRQTRQRFNYQAGKSQLIMMTGNLDLSGGGTGVQRRIGQFDDDNGFFFELDAGTLYVAVRSSTTGSAEDTRVAQSNWNLDVMDGTGSSGITLDITKAQIFVIDYEWLGVGRVRFGLAIRGAIIYVHQVLNANLNTEVYISNPNNPLRYQMITTSSSPASSMGAICSTIISEGGQQTTPGLTFYQSTANTNIDAQASGTIYAICGIRMKTTHLGISVLINNVSVLTNTNDDFEWIMLLNPTVANAVAFNDVTNSACQFAVGNAGNPSNSTLTGGTRLDGGYGSSHVRILNLNTLNIIRLGATVGGTRDEIYLGCRPIGAGNVNADIYGGITWQEL